jgi:hypothetical protein
MAKKKKRRYYVYQTGGGDPIIDFNLPKLDPNAPLNPDEAPVDQEEEREKFRQMYNNLFMTPEQKNAQRMRELESRGLLDRPERETDIYDQYGYGDPTVQGPKPKRPGIFDPRRTELHPFIRGLNTVADIATGIGSKINNVRAAKQEQREYLDALAPEEYENMERYGLNELPIFMKTGGMNFKSGAAYKKWLAYGHASGEFAKTPGHTDVSIKGKVKNVKHQTGGTVIDDILRNPNYNKYNFKTDATSGKIGNKENEFSMNKQMYDDVDYIDNLNKIIASGTIPKELDMNFRKSVNPELYTYVNIFNQRSDLKTPEERVKAFYNIMSNNPTVEKIKEKLKSFNPVALFQNRPSPSITFQYGGKSIPETKGLPSNVGDLANVEAERGEAYMDFSGDVYQVAADARTHEQGGEMLPQVHKVLENTSNLRKDRNSKYLKVDPKQFKAITGVNTTKSMSHAEALVKANETLDKQREHIVKKIELAGKDKDDIDKLAENSIKLNMDHFAAIPTKQEMFDRLFNHQEAVKMATNIPTGEAAKMGGYYSTGGVPKYQSGGFTPYPGNKTGLKTPAGNYDAFPAGLTMDQYLKDLQARGFKYEGITDNKQLQQAIYEYTLQSDPERVKKMWQEGMHQKGMDAAKQLGFVDDKGRFKPGVLDNPENLRKLGELYPDGDLGIRTMQLAPPEKRPRVWTDTPPAGPAAPQQKFDPSIKANIRRGQKIESNFFEPLRWYDTASPINAYLASLERIPEKFNPMEFNQLRYKLADPTAALQQNQSDFNAAVQATQNASGAGAGVQLANIANLATRKYAMNNQVVGNFENMNAQTKNQEILYNTQVRDKQSAADQQAREVFEDKVLTSKAKQQEQKLTALDSLYKTIAENRALNRNGNLIMKMSRAFDQYGNYNGYQTQFGVNPMLGMGAPNTGTATGKFQPAGGIQGLTPGKSYYNRRTGKTLYFDGINLQER